MGDHHDLQTGKTRAMSDFNGFIICQWICGCMYPSHVKYQDYEHMIRHFELSEAFSVEQRAVQQSILRIYSCLLLPLILIP